ncbi:MAG: hypothetical protein Q4C37_00860 [Bacteroidales bacterium]|nr:hypothetical protein [Bacteroidales bacterium]
MKTRTTLVAASILLAANASEASEFVRCDFEDCAIGQSFKIWNSFSDDVAATATVEADPLNAGNKVLHVVNHGWNDHVEFQLPPEYADPAFAEKVENISLKICRHKYDQCGEWKSDTPRRRHPRRR